jgi:serine/threonine protein kinase
VLLSGHSPFTGDNKQETYCNITNGPLDFPPYLFGSVSEQAKDFIRKLLVRDPKYAFFYIQTTCTQPNFYLVFRGRINCHDCLKHEWLASETNGPIINTLNANSILVNGQKLKNGEESDSDKENESNRTLYHANGSCDDIANGFKQKRLSSDTFPDRKVVAVVPNETVDEIPPNNDSNNKLHMSENENIISKSRKSPPTPSKKFFLSVDQKSYPRSRSLSLERKSTTSTSIASSGESVEHSVVMQFESMSFTRNRSYVLSEEISVEERIGFVY